MLTVPAEAFYAAQAEAHRRGIPIAGHLPIDIDVRRASAEGLRCIEHLGPGLGILGACAADDRPQVLAAGDTVLAAGSVR